MNRYRRSKRGVAATELAICLPLLIACAVYCVQLSQAYHLKAVANQAAWRATRYASTTRFKEDERDQWIASVQNEAIEELSQVGTFNPDQLQMDIETTTTDERIEIQLQLNLTIVPPIRLTSSEFHFHRTLKVRQYR
ncbi:TadE/TadG family type IV pilus assembly protein [Bremerella cremea]|uniref:TadE/TadG family type IV pilus assembly protein n=1 Tax=Bremerella cremea TaxID=1031537 RepID=UPI0031EEA4EE